MQIVTLLINLFTECIVINFISNVAYNDDFNKLTLTDFEEIENIIIAIKLSKEFYIIKNMLFTVKKNEYILYRCDKVNCFNNKYVTKTFDVFVC